MALGNTSNAIFLSIADGKIVRQFKNPTANSKERTTKTGKVVHEEKYDYVEGIITSVNTRENEYGKFWNITINDGGEEYIIQFNFSGGTASAFLKTLPNVDLSKPVKLTPKQTIENDKKKSTLFINQNGNALKWFWNKDNQGELPQLKKVKVKGKEQWDDSDMMEYLENYVNENIKPQLGKVTIPLETAPPPVEVDEDAPF
jgi:hypothetical protein